MSSSCRRRCTPVIRTRGRAVLLLIPLPSSGVILPEDDSARSACGVQVDRAEETPAGWGRSARRRDGLAPLGCQPYAVGPLDVAGPAELLEDPDHAGADVDLT